MSTPFHARACLYGRHVAQGVLDYGTALAALLALARSSPGCRPDCPVHIVEHLLNLQVVRADDTRAITEAAVASRVRPLVGVFAPADAVFRAAEAVNDAAGHPLLSYEVRAIVRQEMARQIAAPVPHRSRRGR